MEYLTVYNREQALVFLQNRIRRFEDLATRSGNSSSRKCVKNAKEALRIIQKNPEQPTWRLTSMCQLR